jgi:predicted 2-oxoglutarate/Fe(II)-dependent dioxygenase YbiX
MRLKNNAWTFEGVLSKDQCDQIIAYGNDQQTVTATVDKFTVNNKRKSEVAWLYDPWIFSMLEPYLHAANLEAGWNFQWEAVAQVQFATYKKGDHYDWHRDTDIPLREDGKIRKLSMTVNLNDDYKGGEMYIDAETNYGKKDPQQLKKLQTVGSISVFPSDKWHKVAKVTEGTRYSLVVWFLGEAWK